MKLIDLYRQIIKCGTEEDPRKNKSLIKSYPDSRLLYGSSGTLVNKIMVGIDIEVADILLADHIRSKEGLDLVLGHHPEGIAYTGLHEVMRLQVDLLQQAGVKRHSAEHGRRRDHAVACRGEGRQEHFDARAEGWAGSRGVC